MQRAQVVDDEAEVVDRAVTLVARRLGVQVQSSGSDPHEDVAGSAEVAVETDDAPQRLAIPGHGRVEVAAEEMGVVEVDHVGVRRR